LRKLRRQQKKSAVKECLLLKKVIDGLAVNGDKRTSQNSRSLNYKHLFAIYVVTIFMCLAYF